MNLAVLVIVVVLVILVLAVVIVIVVVPVVVLVLKRWLDVGVSDSFSSFAQNLLVLFKHTS